MKLKKTVEKIEQSNKAMGLLTFRVAHTIASSSGGAWYTGPKLEPAQWQQVLSLFKWTHEEHKSESQVRMYANPALNRIAFWAHPQEMGTGMSARELNLSVEERRKDSEERFRFWGVPPSGEWVYFGTIHHHCSAGAFQSSVDEHNEVGQDGLHITIGHMDSSKGFSLHARFYHNRMEFEPDLSEFWDVGEPWSALPSSILNHDALARMQMTEPVPDSIEPPQVWKDNIREAPKPSWEARGLGYGPAGYGQVVGNDDWGFYRGDSGGSSKDCKPADTPKTYRSVKEQEQDLKNQFGQLLELYDMELLDAERLLDEVNDNFYTDLFELIEDNGLKVNKGIELLHEHCQELDSMMDKLEEEKQKWEAENEGMKPSGQ